MKGRWLPQPWIVVNCDNREEQHFATRKEAEQWVKRQSVLQDRLILYPDSPYRILSAQEVRDIEACGALLSDDFGESNRWV